MQFPYPWVIMLLKIGHLSNTYKNNNKTMVLWGPSRKLVMSHVNSEQAANPITEGFVF